VKHGVRILGPVNLVSAMAFQASQLYARNVLNFLLLIYDKQGRKLALDDEVAKACIVARDGELVQAV
jgi:NAD(P) transhydrogenase subunit alpha